MKRYYCLLLFLYVICSLQGQTYTLRSVVADASDQPIEAVTCVLQEKEQQFLQAAITDSLGRFSFSNLPSGYYSLTLHHLSYAKDTLTFLIEADTLIPLIRLTDAALALEGAVVIGERPLVKAQDGKLVYDVSQLTQNRLATNAYEVLKVVPNILEGGGRMQLIGADGFTLMLNGKPSGLSKEQVIRLLKTMPVSKVKNIEILYSAPPQYGVRGAVVNVVLDQQVSDQPLFQGELTGGYTQATYASYHALANVLLNQPNYSVDITLGGEEWKARSKQLMHAIHSLGEEVYDIDQQNRATPKGTDWNTRLSVDYRLKNKDLISGTYTGEYGSSRSILLSAADYQVDNLPWQTINSRNETKGNDRLHHARLDYTSYRQFTAGLDYTFYKDPSRRMYQDYSADERWRTYKIKHKQQIDKITFYANKEHSFNNECKLDYGATFSHSTNNNDYASFLQIASDTPDSISITKQKEWSGTAYVGFSKSFSPKLTAQISLSANYFRATIHQQAESEKVLWNRFKPFANANISYTFSDKHRLQLALTTDVKYPPYWALNADEVAMNAYSVVKGNPELKFSESYASRLIYVFKKKYILIGSYKYDADYFTQLPYQSDKELKNIFQVVNLDYRQTTSLAAVIPLRISTFADAKTTLSYVYTKEKDSDFLAVPYNRSKHSFVVNFNGGVRLSSQPDIRMDISAFYMNGAIQGIYDVHHMHSVDAGIRWTFLQSKAELTARVVDIFNGSNGRATINYANQRSTLTNYSDTPSFTLSFLFRFGDYKGKEHAEVDKSRLGR